MNIFNFKQQLASHIINRNEIKQLFKHKNVQVLQKNQLILSEIQEKPLNPLKQMLYQMMKDELKKFGYSEFRYVSESLQGYVVLAKEKITNKRFAIKGILIRDLEGNIDQNEQGQVKKETDMLQQCLGSPYVSNLIKTIDGNKFTFLVLTECLGTMKELIDSTPDNKLNEISAIKYCKDIAQGLYYIHSKQCMVNDLKFDNVLIDYNGNAVICDLGFAQNLSKDSKYSILEYMDKFYFQAPELYDPNIFKDYDCEYKKRKIQTQTNTSHQNSVACSLGYIFYVMIQGFNLDLAFKKHLDLPFDQNFQTFKYKKQIRYIIDGLTKFDPKDILQIEEVLILLKGIISHEFDLDSKFIDLISKDTLMEANKLNKEIEFIQNFNNKYYAVFKNEGSFLQELLSNQEEIQKGGNYSKNSEYQISSLKALQVQEESKVKDQEIIIKQLETKITNLTQEIQDHYQQKEAARLKAESTIKEQERIIKEQETKLMKLNYEIKKNEQNEARVVKIQNQVSHMRRSRQTQEECKCEANGKCIKKAIKCSQCGHQFCGKQFRIWRGGKECGKVEERGAGCCQCQQLIEIKTFSCEYDCKCEFCQNYSDDDVNDDAIEEMI